MHISTRITNMPSVARQVSTSDYIMYSATSGKSKC